MKTAFITGAGSDIGREVALLLGTRGYKILAHAKEKKCPKIEHTTKVLKRENIAHAVYVADFTSKVEVTDMCNEIIKNESELEIIVHVAGGGAAFGHDKITPEQLIDLVNLNLIAPMMITHKLLPLLTDGSLIVFTSALSGFHAGWYPSDACFDAAKGGLMRFTENMARNLAPKTRVNCIVIGLSYVEDNLKEWREGMVGQIPMGRIAYPKDYVKCIDFFLNHDYITGVSLPLDGGWQGYNVNPPPGTSKKGNR